MIESELFDRLRNLSNELRSLFSTRMNEVENTKHVADLEGWSDYFWESDIIRKAHLKTIEPVGKNKLWLMHINIFPREHVNLPIFGLDIVANPKKISGCFCDYSPITEGPHPYLDKFKYETDGLTWTRARVMPEWAEEIFSENIVGAGSIREGEETNQLCDMALNLASFYCMEMSNPTYSKDKELNTLEAQNKYCRNQKMNKMLHSSILAMGISEERKNQYVENVLFEEV
jgi:phycocyanobilin:ferredoxin oxidoreductase